MGLQPSSDTNNLLSSSHYICHTESSFVKIGYWIQILEHQRIAISLRLGYPQQKCSRLTQSSKSPHTISSRQFYSIQFANILFCSDRTQDNGGVAQTTWLHNTHKIQSRDDQKLSYSDGNDKDWMIIALVQLKPWYRTISGINCITKLIVILIRCRDCHLPQQRWDGGQ